jgi:ADP-ribosylglycohydrolase
MIGAIVGDILGSTWEFKLEKPQKEPPFFLSDSHITDDSILTTATAHALLHKSSFKDAYCSFFKLYTGHNKGMPSAINAGFGGMFVDWALRAPEDQHPYFSYGNGSAMRVSPVGWIANSKEEVLSLALQSSYCTHDHPEGIKGAQSTAMAIYLARQGMSKKDIFSEITSLFDYPCDLDLDWLHEHYLFNETCPGSLPQAFSCVYHANSFEETISNALYIGGDSDTICAIAGSIAEAIWGVPEKMANIALNILYKNAPLMAGIVMEFEKRYGNKIC